jgi:hypothetical protein
LLVGAFVVLGFVAAFSLARQQFGPLAAIPAPATMPVIVPSRATEGVIAFAIPRGAAEAQVRGDAAYVLPDTMRLTVADRVIVRNDDTTAHVIFSALIKPGRTEIMTFSSPGIEVYSSGCAIHGGGLNAFTSVIVSAG